MEFDDLDRSIGMDFLIPEHKLYGSPHGEDLRKYL